MGYQYDSSTKLSFDAQRAYEHRLRRAAAHRRTANQRSHRQRRWLILTAALLMLALLSLGELRIGAPATAAPIDTRSRPQVIRTAQPAARATTATTKIMQPSAFESATHSAGVFPVVPQRFPDVEQGTEGATTTTGTLFIVQ